jgi:hypothetical protein
MSNTARVTAAIRALPYGPWPPNVEAAIVAARAKMSGLEADEFDAELERALDTLRDHRHLHTACRCRRCRERQVFVARPWPPRERAGEHYRGTENYFHAAGQLPADR